MKNRIPFLLSVAGGLMLIISSAAGDVGFLDTIAVIVASIPELQPFLETLEIIRFALGGLASLGGNIVIIGGFLLTIDRVTTGKILIGLGAGMGIFGLVIQIGTLAYTTGLGVAYDWLKAFATTTSGAGVLCTIAARLFARKAK
ncbi:MAG: hypothetical protein ACFE8Z_06570 [Candidatus Hermodarchaeota archaeon]